ncbi:MAG: folate family ECF transporter S component [Oscillospiraceae bacterium]|nr:folate family ECF transporter S component [Oscillospiraceae bacterium]MBR1845189.1 folate family ECF transporter S component [Oscillospiraceae bacterium]
MKSNITRKLVFMALLCAISVVLTRVLAINTHTIRISFGAVPIILAGLFFGPIEGAMVGFVADIVGCLFLSGFGYTPVLALSPILMGSLPALLVRLFPEERDLGPLELAAAVFPTEILGPICWTTFGLHLLYGTPIPALLAARIPLYLITGALDTLLVFLLLKSGVFQRLGLQPIRGRKKA